MNRASPFAKKKMKGSERHVSINKIDDCGIKNPETEMKTIWIAF
jgi:hypothetical protein